jgi:methylase of polypeptide subunit release factors
MARTARDILETLNGAFTLPELYELLEAAGIAAQDGATDVVHGATDTRWRRAARGALQTLKRSGKATRAGDLIWVLNGTPARPRTALLVSLTGRHADVELRLSRAAELLGDLDEPADLVLCDPPYGLGVGTGDRDTGVRVYGRDESCVVDGYVDVDPAVYRAFTTEWVTAAAAALRPGGYLAAVTGPQQSAWVQVAAEDAGLTYVNSVAVGKVFPVRTTRRFAHGHWNVIIMAAGPLDSARRHFTPPPGLPRAASGADYPTDMWATGTVGRANARPGELRYRNSLPPLLVGHLLDALATPGAGPTVDPFNGGGTTALECLKRGIPYIGGDVNPKALAFTAHRLSQWLGAGTAGPAAGSEQLALL